MIKFELVVSSDGKWAAVADPSRSTVYDLSTGRIALNLEHRRSGPAISADGGSVAEADPDGILVREVIELSPPGSIWRTSDFWASVLPAALLAWSILRDRKALRKQPGLASAPGKP